MTKRLILLFALLCSTPAWGGIAFFSASSTNCSQTSASTGVACTLAASTTVNDLVVVGLSWQNTSASISKVVGSASGSYFIPYSEECNSSNVCAAVLLCVDCATITKVTPTFSASTLYELNVSEYLGVSWVGITNGETGSSTAPGLTYTTGDPNDWVVTETASLGNAGVPTAGAGNLRDANRTGTTSSSVAGALVDSTVATAGSLTTTATIASGIWSAAGVELRTTAPKTYIWPDCDSTHPCVIHHRDTVAYGTSGDSLKTPFNVWVQSSQTNNLVKLTITHPSAITIGSIVDNNSNTWANGASITDTTNSMIVETRYVCGAGAGVHALQIPWTGTLAPFSEVQISYDEISGIATSSCSDGTNGAFDVQGTIQPGSITPSESGDLVYTYGIDTTGNAENGYPSGWEMADDSSTIIMEAPFENYAESLSVHASTAAINPTLYVWAMDVSEKDNWTVIEQAFKASSGSGTQPPAGRAWVVREMQYYNDNVSTLGYLTFPTNGNAIVVQTSNPQFDNSLTTIADNVHSTYTLNPINDTTSDPQQYAACLNTGGVAKDRTLTWTTGMYETHIDWYDIAGAKQASGSGCIGTMTNNNYYGQAATTNSNVVGDPVVSATLNGSAYSAIFTTSYLGQGPPSGPCISGGVTPPGCTGDMTIFNMNSIWASGMQDGSHWYSGDPVGYWYTNSTSPFSVDYLMANGTGSQGLIGAAIEILGAVPPVSGMLTPTAAVVPSASSITTQQALSVTVTVSGGSGNSTPTGTVTLAGGGYSSEAATLSDGSTTINIPAGSLAVGSDTFTASYTPDADSSTYNSATGTSPAVTVTQATPTVSAWPTASSISNGQTLASSTLTGGTASVSGAFAWTAPATVPASGTSFQSVTFTPTDATDYTTVTGQVSVTANNSKLPTVSAWPTASAITYGQTMASSTLMGGTASVPGAFAWTAPATTPSAGTPSESVTFTPTDTTDYSAVTGHVNVIVNKATPTVSAWPGASAITYGQTLASSTLTGGTASEPGAFAWATPSTAPAAGTASEGVTFTPTNVTDYSTVTHTVQLTVNKALLTVTAINASVPYNLAIPNLTYNTAGYVIGDTSSVLSGAPEETTTATRGSPVGTYPITITQGSLAATNYGFQFVNGTLTITCGKYGRAYSYHQGCNQSR